MTRYKVKKKKPGASRREEVSPQGGPPKKVRQEESEAKGFERRKCSAGLLREFSDICKRCVAEGVDAAKDVGRYRHLLRLVNKVHMPGVVTTGKYARSFQDHDRRYSRRNETVHCKNGAGSKATKVGKTEV